MGSVLLPQCRSRLPHHGPDRLLELQNKCNKLEAQGILAKPEQVGINVEYLNLTFLVQKSNGGTRLVTDFGDVGRYSKPQSFLLSNTDSNLHSIGVESIETMSMKMFVQQYLIKIKNTI